MRPPLLKRKAVSDFFRMDLLTSIHAFFRHADGTFGVSASCTLWPGTIVLAAKGQPVSMAFDVDRPIVVWSSEPGSLMVRWPSGTSRGPALRILREDGGTCVPRGETAQLVGLRRRIGRQDGENTGVLKGSFLKSPFCQSWCQPLVGR